MVGILDTVNLHIKLYTIKHVHWPIAYDIYYNVNIPPGPIRGLESIPYRIDS